MGGENDVGTLDPIPRTAFGDADHFPVLDTVLFWLGSVVPEGCGLELIASTGAASLLATRPVVPKRHAPGVLEGDQRVLKMSLSRQRDVRINTALEFGLPFVLRGPKLDLLWL